MNAALPLQPGTVAHKHLQQTLDDVKAMVGCHNRRVDAIHARAASLAKRYGVPPAADVSQVTAFIARHLNELDCNCPGICAKSRSYNY